MSENKLKCFETATAYIFIIILCLWAAINNIDFEIKQLHILKNFN